MTISTRLMLAAMALLFAFPVLAQQNKQLAVAQQYIKDNYQKWNLSEDDIADLHLQYQYESKHNGVTHFYFIQRYKGIEIYNAVLNVAVTKEGRALHIGERFYKDIQTKINATTPAISAEDAIWSATTFLGAPVAQKTTLALKEKKAANDFVFEKNGISESDIPVKLRYQPLGDKLVLAWDLAIDMPDNADYWSIRMDALTGEALNKNNYTVYCNPTGLGAHRHSADCTDAHNTGSAAMAFQPPAATEGSYRVFKLPAESPIHGPHVMVENPADTLASPYGWHDTNGAPGVEFTITRGNNVHAYLDAGNTNTSAGDEPDGGANLVFDFPFDPVKEPADLRDAAVTNLFYMNNMMHDITYNYGFTEAAGNFQAHNYGRGGAANDEVEAQAQDGGGTNNANFSTPSDGANGRMQMYLWEGGAGNLLTVNTPTIITGVYETGEAGFGSEIRQDNPVTGDIVIAKDGIEDPYGTDACEVIQNTTELAGKIAMIDRGGCEFGSKALRAQNAGAVACIICNFEDAVIGMGGGRQGGLVRIPVVMLKSTDCALIRANMANGPVNATFVLPQPLIPAKVDGDFDNGIIAHEYGHGVSIRLTGGPQNSGCLGNQEQMGEGWSDFFSLVTSVNSDDSDDLPRGIGTYAQRERVDGRGIRPYPYTTDMTINPATYEDIATLSVPHGVGFVWCTMLWDLYWAFVKEYGYDPDVKNGKGGNNMAIQLVMDGMKLQPCNPGFADGRDAIIAADILLYNGVHECLIWEVFARRGLGFYANQGGSDSRGDGIEDFNPMPTCIKELKINKEATELIQAGEPVTFTITVTNHKDDTAPNVVITDELPSGLSYGSLVSVTGMNMNNVNVNTSLPGAVAFGLGDMATGAEIVLTYRANSSRNNFSIQQYLDEIDNPDIARDKWLIGYQAPDDANNSNPFTVVDTDANSAPYAWHADDNRLEIRQFVFNIEPFLIEGNKPVLRFYHKMDSEPGTDGGVVEYSEDGVLWRSMRTELFKNPYTGLIDYGTFVIPNFAAFWGNSNNYIGSYADLSGLKGKEVFFRFRFATNDDSGTANFFDGDGWYVDDFELMDMFNYDGEVCVTSGAGDRACAKAKERGTIVQSSTVGLKDLDQQGNQVAVYPNPASDLVYVALKSTQKQDFEVSVLSAEGKLMQQQKISAYEGDLVRQVDLRNLPTGIYLVKIQTATGAVTEKIFKQ